MQILFDHDLESVLPMEAAIAAVRNFFVAASHGNVVTPPRHSVSTSNGGLTFTIGAEAEFTKTIGFRVYDTFPHAQGTNRDQVVAVYCNDTGRLKTMVIGGLLGAIRTAAIASASMDCSAPADATSLVLLGAGHHAYFQAAGALLKPSAFVSSIDPKTRSAHELPTDIQRGGSFLVTDSKVQLSSYGEPYFLPDIDSIAALEHLVSGEVLPPRGQNTFFLSAGRSGTEVVVVEAALQLAAKHADRGSMAQLYASPH